MNIARKLKTLWNMKLTVIPILVDALGTLPIDTKNRIGEREISERIETIHSVKIC